MNPLARGLLNLAIKIGRWILDVAARRGGAWLADYLDERASSVLARRLANVRARLVKAKTTAALRRLKTRMTWLAGRIARWKAAAKWLRAKASELDDKVIAAVCSLPEVKAIPLSAACEAEPK